MDPCMYNAAKFGDVGFLQKIKDGGVSTDLGQKTSQGNNILHLAAEFKQISFFREVPSFDKGFPLVWDINKMGDTPLHIAARVGCDELVKFLIDHAKSLDVHRTDDQESGPTYAESYRKLLRKTNSEMHTALHVAARYGRYGVVTSLMEADPELCCSTNSAKESPLFMATCKGFSNIARYILNESSASPSFQGINGVTALHAAVTHKYIHAEGIVEIMVSKYPDMIKEADSLGWTPLHYASWRGNLEAIQLLVQGDKFSTYILDKSGMSALHIAAYKGHIKVMEKLIEHQPDTCECLNAKEQTILHVAVLGAQCTVVEYILKMPENERLRDQVDKEGNTPLHLAVICQNHQIIRILTPDYGMDTSAIDETKFSLVFDNFLGDNIELQEIIDNSYLVRSFGVPSVQQHISRDFVKFELHPEENNKSSTLVTGDNREDLETRTKEPLRSNDTNLIIATLIATATFAAALTPPGGYGSDGKTILHDNSNFQWFQTFNTMSFVFSIFVLLYETLKSHNLSNLIPVLRIRRFIRLVSVQSFEVVIRISLLSMFTAFLMGLQAGQPKDTKPTAPSYWLSLVYSVFMLLGMSPFIVRGIVYRIKGDSSQSR